MNSCDNCFFRKFCIIIKYDKQMCPCIECLVKATCREKCHKRTEVTRKITLTLNGYPSNFTG